ncbi:MAG: ribosomal protein S18-alanine N-acetyltransferase [Pseudomonadota bacterium]
MTHAEQLAALHATSFTGGARWSAQAFQAALDDPLCFFVFDQGGQSGFALGRIVVDEAELLTLIVDPAARRQGRGRALLQEFEQVARARGAVSAFLEVAVSNADARALYQSAGWDHVGTRTGYYGGKDALVLRKPL